MTSPIRLEVATFPEHVVGAIAERRWDELVQALDGGVSAHLYSRGEAMSLFTFVLSYHEAGHEASVSPIPLAVLEAFQRQGMGPGTLVDSMGMVAISAQYAQWQWAHGLLNDGYAPDEAGAQSGCLRALMSGHQSRKRLGLFKTLGNVFFSGYELLREENEQKASPIQELPPNVHALPVPSLFDPEEEASDRAMRRFFEAVDNAARERESNEGWEWRGVVTLLDHLLRRGANQLWREPALCNDCPDAITPLEQAIVLREKAWVTELLDSPHAQQGVPEGALALAARTGDAATLAALVDRLPPARLQEEGARAAMAALASGHRLAFDVLVPAGVSLDIHDERGWSFVQCAAERGAKSVLNFLLRRGINLEAPAEHGPTPADLLRLRHPFLCEVLGVSVPEESPMVRLLRRPSPRR